MSHVLAAHVDLDVLLLIVVQVALVDVGSFEQQIAVGGAVVDHLGDNDVGVDADDCLVDVDLGFDYNDIAERREVLREQLLLDQVRKAPYY